MWLGEGGAHFLFIPLSNISHFPSLKAWRNTYYTILKRDARCSGHLSNLLHDYIRFNA
jgi:hypothetical protein